jgi:molybdopterin-dependent oxidoreductase alpha subunit
MTREAPTNDVDETRLEVNKPKGWAAGIPGVAVSLARSVEQMGTGRTIKALRLLNQREGFDCPGCAWPEPREVDGEHRKLAVFCEYGAKAVAEEATKRRVGREFFAAHPIEDLRGKTDYWLGQQGRITEPFVLREGASHYEPISWDDAFTLVADELNGLADPNEAIFYTSGRTSNEAAFLYQLLVRSYGTNNLPDCSNMCHESSGAALSATTGIGKGSVSLADIHKADLIVVVGQNPGTNHPRMLSALEVAKGNGAQIIAVNPLPEAGLMRFKNPQNVRGVVGKGTPLADEFAQIRLGGDLALFQAVGHLLLAWDEEAPGAIVDRDFVERVTDGFDDYAKHLREIDWPEVERATGLPREQIERVARMIATSERTIYCWAMGLTQHKHAVPTISEIANLALMRGMIGKPGAGLCPVRGHSNVQGKDASVLHGQTGRGVRHRRPPRARLGHGRLDPRDARRPRQGVLRRGRQFRFRHTGYRADGEGAELVRAHRARLDQAQPLARGARPRRSDPAHAGPHRARRPGRRRAVRHGRGLDVAGAHLARAAAPRQ